MSTEKTGNAKASPVALKAKQNRKAWKFVRELNSSSNDALNKLALADGTAKYTYGAMFRQWDRYASVFTALKMTSSNKSRVGLVGSTSAEAIFAFYGLNMVGAEISLIATFCAFNRDKIFETIQNEKLTDIILTDDFAQPNIIYELLCRKDALGLRNVLLLHIPIGGSAVNGMLTAAQESKYAYYKKWFSPICMDTLLACFGETPVEYAPFESSDTAVIIHTSGTTSGTGKPIPVSDSALNAVGNCYYRIDGYDFLKKDLVCGVTIDLSNAYGVINQVHAPFCLGGTVATVPGGTFNPEFYKAIPEFGLTLLFCTGAIFEMWMRQPESAVFDFSSLLGIVIGGANVSAKNKRRYYEFVRKHGAKDIPFCNGYGLSELGGACILSEPDVDDESIGRMMPGVEFCLYDEDSESFKKEEDAPCTGVLYLRSSSMATCVLDGSEIIKTENVFGKKYVNTNDLVHVDGSGKITYLGRSNRYFLNDNGKKFEAGRVETEFARQDGIENCGIVPVYIKHTHDNIPMICIKAVANDGTALDVINAAFKNIFITGKTLTKDDIPLRVLIADELPKNQNGKIDLYKINKGEVTGKKYTVDTVVSGEEIKEIKLTPLKEETDDMLSDVIKEIAKDISANSIPYGFSPKAENGLKQNPGPQAFYGNMNQAGSQMMNMMNMMAQNGMNEQKKQNPMRGMMPNMNQMYQMYQAYQTNPMYQANQMYQMNPMYQAYQANQPNQTNQMNQIMSYYANVIYQMMYRFAENMHNQNVKMVERFNDAARKNTAAPNAQNTGAEKDKNKQENGTKGAE